MNPDDLPWILSHLPGFGRDATRVKSPTFPTQPTIGARTQGNIPIPPSSSALDIARDIGIAGRSALNFLTNGGVNSIEDYIAEKTGRMKVTRPRAIDPSATDPMHKIDPRYAASLQLAGGGDDPFVSAMAGPVSRRAAKVVGRLADDIVPEGTQFFDHYSNADLSGGTLSAKFMGTGLAGRERARPNRPNAMHVYAAGSRPEPQFRNMPRYRVAVTNPKGIYDASEDVDGIVAKFVQKARRAGRPLDADAMEREIEKAGYAGWHNGDPHITKLFGDHPVVPYGQPFNIPTTGEVQLRASRARGGRRGGGDGGALADSSLTNGARALPEMFRGVDETAPFGPNARALYDAEALKGDPNLYSAAGPIKYRPPVNSVMPGENWAVMTAENPHGAEATAEENVAHNARLEAYLKQHGIKYERTRGGGYWETPEKWFNENPLLIHDITAPEAERLARVFNQNSVLTKHGLHDIQNGGIVPTKGLRYAEGKDGYFDLGAKGKISSMLDWEGEKMPLMGEPPAGFPEGGVADSVVAPAFYSRLERAIQGGQQKATPAQWLAQLSKNVNSDERLYTGVDAFLKGADPTKAISRDDVMKVFKQGEIKLGRKTLGGDDAAMHTVTREGNRFMVRSPDGSLRGGYYDENDAVRAARAMDVDLGARPKFATYTEPGGTNYRENLTMLERRAPTAPPMPEGYTLPKGLRVEKNPHGFNGQDVYNVVEDDDGGAIVGNWAQSPDEAIRAYWDGEHRPGQPPAFHNSHFPDDNLLLHTRTKERTLPNGEKVLHAEEIQSDWHEKGRKLGYVPSDLTEQHTAAAATLGDLRDKWFQRLDDLVAQAHGDKALYDNLIANDPTLATLRDAYVAADAHVTALRKLEGGVPDAPFKKTDDWQMLGMKQIIDDAVRGGHDRIAWTPGNLQAKRYSLSNVADRIEYHPRRNQLVVWNGDELVHMGNYDPKALPSVIGKDAAANLLGGTPHPNGMLSLEGDGLSVGGGGMRTFYDEMLPKNLNKYLKSLGLPPAEITPPDALHEAVTLPGNRAPVVQPMPFPSFKISPELRRHVLTKGQPLLGLLGAFGLGAAATSKKSDSRGRSKGR